MWPRASKWAAFFGRVACRSVYRGCRQCAVCVGRARTLDGVFSSLRHRVSSWGVNMGWVPGYFYPSDLCPVLVFQRRVPVRPTRCTATSTAPGAEARPHDGLACQVSAATVLGKGSHGRRFHSTIDAPRPLLGEFFTNRGPGPHGSMVRPCAAISEKFAG